MSDHLNPDPESHLDPLAAALSKLRPAPASAEKPAFLFRAGQASRDAAVRRWQAACAMAVLALAVSVTFGYVRSAEYRERAEAAEARAQELTSAALATPPAPLPAVGSPPVTPPVPAPFAVPDVPSARPADPYYDPDPTPRELADALRLRNEILVGGLTMLPKSNPPVGTAHPLPGGVFTTPKFEPNKLPPIIPDDE